MRKVIIVWVFFGWGTGYASVQSDTLLLDLNSVVALANKASLAAFRAKNIYLADYWAYRSFKADRLPALRLHMTPVRLNREFTSRYDYIKNTDIYRQQQTFYTSGALSLSQNFDWLGGHFFVDSELGRFRNFSNNPSFTQYNTVPFRIGYRQELLGYNSFKWERKIAPLKYEAAQRELLYTMQAISEEAAGYFFDLAMAQAQRQLAQENLKSGTKLYEIGQERQKIAGITPPELYTLKLDNINAHNALQNANIQIKRAMFALVTYLNLGRDVVIALQLPALPKPFVIDMEEALRLAKECHPQFLRSKQRILEAQQEQARSRIQRYFTASLSATVGFNQVAETFSKAYNTPAQQDVFLVTLSVPLLDWGVGKGRYNMARRNLNVAELTAEQEALKVEQEIIVTVGDFSVQQDLIQSAEEALRLAKMAYGQTRERFIIGKADINSLTLANNRYQEAQRNYISALRNYWLGYFRIRRLTLYDFEKGQKLSADQLFIPY